MENFSNKAVKFRPHYSHKILKCFRPNGGIKKWRNRFKIEKLVVLAEYFEEQIEAAEREEKLAIQGEVLREGIGCFYILFLIKQMETMPRSHQWSVR